MYNRHRRLFQASVATTRAYHPTVRVGVLCAVGFAVALFAGCGELEPMREPEVVDLELTTDTLKASVRDAQRMVTELRADLETRRRDLAEAQIARAQLEGRVREAERRVVEARQVIELQREELAAARTESTRASRSSLQLPGRMRQLQKPVSKTGKSSPAYDEEEGATLLFSSATHKRQKVIGVEEQKTSTQQVSVKPGDTLWRIAQKYRVHLEHLRSLNRLTDNRIVIGQTLWLPDDRPRPGVGDDKGASTP